MKKIITVLILTVLTIFGVRFFSESSVAATTEGIKTYGIASVMIIENIIKQQLKREFNSDFSVKLGINSIADLKNGFFKSLSLHTKSITYKGLSFSDFSASTVNSENRVIYKDKKLYYPVELPLKFSGKITNDNINTILNSDLFKQKFYAAQQHYGGFFTLDIPNVTLNDNKMYFELPVKTFWMRNPFNININSEVYVVNNEILLRNISYKSGSNIIDISMFDALISALNPLKINSETLSGKYCKVIIESAQTQNSEITVDGNLIINANYGVNND